MRFALTEQQVELRDAVRAVLARECTTADVRTPDAGAHRRWSVLAELGATGLVVPEASGGIGLGFVDLVGVLEEAGWAALPEPLAESAALAAPLLASAAAGAADGAQAGSMVRRWLPEVAGGGVRATVGGIAVTAGEPTTTTVADGAGPGTVRTPTVAGASGAGLFVLATAGPAGWELHAVPSDRTWVTATPSLCPSRDPGTVEWTPDPATLLAGGPHAAALVSATADRAAVAVAAGLTGLAERMVGLSADYARARIQFGKPIGSFQAVKHHLADARVKLEFARPALYRAADSLDRASPARSRDASLAKALASDTADLAARVALQVHGAIGYTEECDLQLFLKRAWALSAAWGDASTHRARVLAAAVAASAGPH